jgi:hypothetical protein
MSMPHLSSFVIQAMSLLSDLTAMSVNKGNDSIGVLDKVIHASPNRLVCSSNCNQLSLSTALANFVFIRTVPYQTSLVLARMVRSNSYLTIELQTDMERSKEKFDSSQVKYTMMALTASDCEQLISDDRVTNQQCQAQQSYNDPAPSKHNLSSSSTGYEQLISDQSQSSFAINRR